jgi:hypothetical protein
MHLDPVAGIAECVEDECGIRDPREPVVPILIPPIRSGSDVVGAAAAAPVCEQINSFKASALRSTAAL